MCYLLYKVTDHNEGLILEALVGAEGEVPQTFQLSAKVI